MLFISYLNFCLDLLIMQQNGLIIKIILISNFMTSQPGYQTIVIHIFPNISRSKDNQTMKFSQLIEYNIKNIFLKKSYTKCSGETSPRPFFEKFKLSISLDQQCKVLFSFFFFFFLYAKLRVIDIYWNYAADCLLVPNIKLISKIKRGLELVSLSHFLYSF